MKALTIIRGALFLLAIVCVPSLWGNTTQQVTVRQVDSLGNVLVADTYVATDVVFSTVCATHIDSVARKNIITFFISLI